jgi:bifunctional ADP-heptose synthase (sugar kinase/adenylyltransferase)
MHGTEKIIVTSGAFDPLSLEELIFLKKCKRMCDWLVIGIHSDWWMLWSQGGFVQNYDTRREILSNLRCVDEIFTFNDSDGTILQLLKLSKICYPNAQLVYMSDNNLNNMTETKIKGITFETMK